MKTNTRMAAIRMTTIAKAMRILDCGADLPIFCEICEPVFSAPVLTVGGLCSVVPTGVSVIGVRSVVTGSDGIGDAVELPVPGVVSGVVTGVVTGVVSGVVSGGAFTVVSDGSGSVVTGGDVTGTVVVGGCSVVVCAGG